MSSIKPPSGINGREKPLVTERSLLWYIKMPGALRYRGLEAWLENANGNPISLLEKRSIDETEHKISITLHIDPARTYTLRWCRSAGLRPMSALCQVFVENGYYDTDAHVEVVSLVMNSSKRVTQSRQSKGWLNGPYHRKGYLRTAKKAFRYSLGSVRLVIRKVHGAVLEPKWVVDDVGFERAVVDFDNMNIDEEEEPYAIFEFNFRDENEPIWERDTPADNKTSVSRPSNATKRPADDIQNRDEPRKRARLSSISHRPTPDFMKTPYVKVEMSTRPVDTDLWGIRNTYPDLQDEYEALEAIERELAEKLSAKMQSKQRNIDRMRRLLETP
ncbi:unnamed protein product [Cyclocybe aegerita]|uniref:Uncharacterized protein n=1 Tax=Cyclocybe aegerita TaxID=1973307 RepID=A0A8S0WWZ9_CYCAE|nr:unnamed protein product [Cyclocybe aegerita]